MKPSRAIRVVAWALVALACALQAGCTARDAAPEYEAQVMNPDFNGGLLLPGGKGLLVWGSDGTLLRSDDGTTWTHAVTPTNADIVQVAANADGSTLIAAGAKGALLRSTDAGRTWQSATEDFAATDFKALIWHAPADTWIAAGTHGRILRSNNAGKTWTAVPSNLDLEFQSLYVDPQTRSVLIGGENGAVGLSLDAGESWKLTQISMADPLTPITGFQRDGKLLIARSALGRFLTSEDDAKSWRLVQSGASTYFTAGGADPRVGSLVMTGHNGNLLRSTDGGRNWSDIQLGGDARQQYLSAIDFDAATGIFTIVGHNGVVARSDNGGEGWISYSIGNFQMHGLIPDRERHRYFAYGAGGLLASSDDNGATWRVVRAPVEVSLRDVMSTPSGNALIATGKLGAVIRSTDGGATWSSVEPQYPDERTPPDLRMLVRSPAQDSLVAVGPPGTILRSNGDGSAWGVTQWTPIEAERAFTWVVADRTRSRLTSIEARGEMRVSDDDGRKWLPHEAPTQGTDWAFWHGALLERDGVMIVAGKSGTAVRSTDGGLTWSAMKTGTEKDLFGSFADEARGLMFLMGQQGTLLRSADGAVTWQAVTSGTDRELRRMLRDPKTGALIAFGAYGSIVRSEDAGLTWQVVPSGTDGELRKGMVDAGSGALFIAGSRGAVLRSRDGGRTWEVLPSHTTRHLSSLVLDERNGDLIVVGDRIVRLTRGSRR